jgi:hypothetical protein
MKFVWLQFLKTENNDLKGFPKKEMTNIPTFLLINGFSQFRHPDKCDNEKWQSDICKYGF